MKERHAVKIAAAQRSAIGPAVAIDDNTGATPAAQRGAWLPRVFWIVACVDVLLFPGGILNVWTYPRGQFDGLVVFSLLVLIGVIVVTMGIVALIRRPAAYWIALLLVVVPLLLLGLQMFSVTLA